MKKNYPSPQFFKLIWRIGGALLLLAIVFLVHSCRKSTLQNQADLNAQSATVFPVNDAMAWFNRNKVALSTKVKINSDASVLNLIAGFTPVWDSARTAVDTNYYVVEAPARYLQPLGFSADSNNINGITRLLVLKSKKLGSLSAALMHIRGNAGVSISNVHYMDVPQAFSGNIFYTSLQGAFMCGYIFESGKITKRSVSGSAGSKPGGLQILQAYVDPNGDGCTSIATNWYSHDCFWNADDSFDHCTSWHFMYTSVDTYCPDPNGPGDPYGGDGASVPPPPDCPPGMHPADDSGSGGDGSVLAPVSIKGKLVINFTYGSTSTCVPDTVVNKNKIIKNYCDNLTDNQKNAINASVDSLSNYDCTSKFLYGYLANTLGMQYSFCIGTDPNPTYSMSYNPDTKGFTYATDDMTGVAFVSSLEHEFFHALQDALVGTSGYGKNATTGVPHAGFVDIEFEQAVFHDIESGNYSAFDKGTQAQQTAYEAWIRSLTDNGAAYPQIDSTNTAAYADFINQYNSFLSQFNDLPGNVYHSDILNLTPTSLMFIFNHTDPNC